MLANRSQGFLHTSQDTRATHTQTHTPNRFDEAAEMASPEQSDEKLAFSVVSGRCSTAFATKQIEIQAPSTLNRVNVKTHMRNENDLRPHYRFHIVFRMFCIHVPHRNYFDKQLLSWLRYSAKPLCLDYRRAIRWYLQLISWLIIFDPVLSRNAAPSRLRFELTHHLKGNFTHFT